MNDLFKKRQAAQNLVKNKKFYDAVEICADIYLNHEKDTDQWDVWRYALCLKNVRKYKESAEICEKFIETNPEQNESINNLYAWNLYYLYIKKPDKRHDLYLQAINKIKALSSPNNRFSAFVPTAYLHLKKITNNINFPSEEILSWTQSIDLTQLDDKVFSTKDNKGKAIEIASQKEYFYSWQAKALYNTQKFNECIECCKEADKNIQKFHYSNEIWFKRFTALSLHSLKKHEKAIQIFLKDILPFKQEWFILKDIADIYYHISDYEKAYEFSLRAILEKGKDELKVSVYMLLANILCIKKDFEYEKKIYVFVYLIRMKMGWNIDDTLSQKIEKHNLNPDQYDLNKLRKELFIYFNSLNNNSIKLYEGYIISILPNGKAGFIKATDGNSYFFKVSDFKATKNFLKPNQKVNFSTSEGYDAKKQATTINAINVRPLTL